MFHVKEKKVGGHISNIWDLAWIKLFLAKIGVTLFLTFMINKAKNAKCVDKNIKILFKCAFSENMKLS